MTWEIWLAIVLTQLFTFLMVREQSKRITNLHEYTRSLDRELRQHRFLLKLMSKPQDWAKSVDSKEERPS